MIERNKIINSIGWSALDYFIRYGLNFIITIILARILSPDDFGLMGMLVIFISAANLFIDSGFSQALIQRQTTTDIDESTIFFFNLIVGGIVALCLCIAVPWIVSFYKQPVLRGILICLALNLFINSLGTIHVTLLTKELNFKIILKANVLASLISGVVAIYMAVSGSGVWSLVVQALLFSITFVSILWIWHPWRPRWVFSFSSLKTYFSFGGFILINGLLNNLYLNLYALIIGKIYLVRDVGYYSRAQKLQQLPVSVLTDVVGRVAFPLFSSTSDNKDKLARGLRKATSGVMLINIPIMVLLVVLAEPIVLTLLGSKWLPLVPLLRILSLGGFLWPLHSLNLNVLKAQGHTDLNVRLMIIKLTIGLVLLFATSPYGVLAIVWGRFVSSVLAFFVNAYYAGVLLNYGAWMQLRDISPYLMASFPMAIVAWLFLKAIHLPAPLMFILPCLLSVMIYIITCKYLKLNAYVELVEVIQVKWSQFRIW